MRGSSPRMTMWLHYGSRFLSKQHFARATCCIAPGKRLPPRRAVLFVLRLDGVAGLRPVGVGPVAQLIKVAAHGERLAAVHGDGFAIDPVAAARNQKYREILQFLHAAD